MKSSAIVVSLLFFTALLAGAAAQADVIFDNFGPGNAYNTIPAPQADYDTNWASTGSLFNRDIATHFGTVAATQYLTSVDLAITEAGATDSAYIYLMSATPAMRVNTELEAVPTSTESWGTLKALFR